MGQRFISLTFNDGNVMSWLGAGFFGNTIVVIPVHVAGENDTFIKVVQVYLGIPGHAGGQGHATFLSYVIKP